MSEEEKPRSGFSFGFSKKKEASKLKLKDSAIRTDDAETAEDPDYITSVEGKEVKSVKEKQEEAKQLVIPLINVNNWKGRRERRPEDVEKDDQPQDDADDKRLEAAATAAAEAKTGDDVTDQAVSELLTEAAQQQEQWEKTGVIDRSMAVPLLMKNKVPEGYETDDKLDVCLRPDEAAPADYDQVPIEQYGLAVLRGMGWKEGQGIGNNHKNVTPIEAVARPKGMGLGADRSLSLQKKAASKGRDGDGDTDENLPLKKDALCQVQSGKHIGLYGMVEGMDEENARVMLKMTLSRETVTFSELVIRVVSKKEYDKYSKYLNKSKVDKYKEEEARKQQDSEGDRNRRKHSPNESDSDSSTHKKGPHRHKHDNTEAEGSRKHRRNQRDSGDKYSDDYRDSEDSHSQHKERHKDGDGGSRRDSHKKSRHREDRSEEGKKRKCEDNESSSGQRSSMKSSSHSSANGCRGQDSQWLRQSLRVRIIDSKYKKGKYNKTKVVIEDVVSFDSCSCRSDDGDYLEDLTQSQLETVIPKSDPAYVMVVKGKHKGELGELLTRHKSSCTASVQLLSDRDMLLSLDYNDICEYTGDINAAFDY